MFRVKQKTENKPSRKPTRTIESSDNTKFRSKIVIILFASDPLDSFVKQYGVKTVIVQPVRAISGPDA